MTDKQKLSALLAESGFELPGRWPSGALDNLHKYLEALLKWNKVMNLVGPETWDEIVRELILDCFQLASFMEELPLPSAFVNGPGKPLCWDFGSGAGIPGIPLRILWQKGEYHLVEPREKRALFMQKILAELKLPSTRAHRQKAGDFMKGASPAHILISRAFLPWPELLELAGGVMDHIDRHNKKTGDPDRPSIMPGGLVICLANEPVPQQLPGAWAPFGQRGYTLPTKPAKIRHIWALRLISNPNMK